MSLAQHSEQYVETLYQHERFADAEAESHLLLSTNADNGRLWLLRGWANYRLRNFDLARTSLEQAGLLVPLDTKTQCMLAECYGRIGAADQARNLYRHLVSDSSCTTESLAWIAAGYGCLRDYDAALEVCRLAAQRDPTRPEPLFGMTFYLRRLGYPASVAIPVMARAFDLAPDELLYRCALAFLLAEDGKNEEAHDLLLDVPAEEIGCPCQLRRMMAIFQTAGDFSRWCACRDQLNCLKVSHLPSSRPR